MKCVAPVPKVLGVCGEGGGKLNCTSVARVHKILKPWKINVTLCGRPDIWVCVKHCVMAVQFYI